MSNSLLYDDNETSTPGDLDKLRKDLAEATTQPSKEATKEQVAKEESELPEKYRGKTAAEIAEMHRNAESELGRRSNELGQYKKLTDELLDLKRREDLAKGGAEEDETEEPLPAISSSDLLEDPTSAIAKLLEARDKSNEKKSQRQRQEELRAQTEAKFLEQHPDAETIVQDPAFVEWVQKSPARALLGYQAAQGDLTSGAALLAEYKARQTSDAANEEAPKDDNLEKARKATTESAKVSQTPDSSSGGKKYRRLDLIRLKLEDPEAYGDENFQREIMQAYAEGRVI